MVKIDKFKNVLMFLVLVYPRILTIIIIQYVLQIMLIRF